MISDISCNARGSCDTHDHHACHPRFRSQQHSPSSTSDFYAYSMLLPAFTRCRSFYSRNTQLFTSSLCRTSGLSAIFCPTLLTTTRMATCRKGCVGSLVYGGHDCHFTTSRIARSGTRDRQELRRGHRSCGLGMESGESMDGSHGVGSVVAGMGMRRARSLQWLRRVNLPSQLFQTGTKRVERGSRKV